MILGVGADIIEVARIQRSYERFGQRFLERILRPEEIAYCLSHRFPAPHLAARFAAKEAISKAFGTGIGKELGWHDLEVARQASGQPVVVLHGQGRELFAQRSATHLHLSLTHTEHYAVAVVVMERAQPWVTSAAPTLV
jgi:holo-[acyl-carrier protein] synthase